MKASQAPLIKGLRLFLAILAIYGLGFLVDGFLRARKGPWIVAFGPNEKKQLEITITQTALGIQGVKITIQREVTENAPIPEGRVEFRSPIQHLPFGRLAYTDLTFLPGVVTMDIEGHLIELMPRAMVINRQPMAWDQKGAIKLEPKDRLPEGPPPPQRQKQLGREIPAR